MSDSGELEERVSLADLYQRMAAAGLGAFFGLVIPGGAGIAAGAALGVGLGPLMAKIRAEWSRDQQRNGHILVESACESSNRSAQDLFALISESPKTRLLFNQALRAATETAWEGKIRALGRAMVQGLVSSDQAVIDTTEKIERAIADINQPELCLLEFLTCYAPRGLGKDAIPIRVNVPEYGLSVKPEPSWSAGHRKWTAEQIERRRPRLRPVMQSLFGTLERHGLIKWNSNSDDNLHKLLEELQRASTIRPAPGYNSVNFSPFRYINLSPDASTCEPTELGEQVYLQFYKAGTGVPDEWLAQDTRS
jgi:hypothetical protein